MLLQKRLVDHLVRRDLPAADHLLGEALASYIPEDLILDVIGPTIATIGQFWEDGQVSVATEHLATNYLRQRLLMWMMSGPPPRQVNPIVLACAPNEWHEGSLLILGALLRRRRWPIAYLGQALPLLDLAGLVRDIHPSMVIMIAMTETNALELADWPLFLPEAAQSGIPVMAYGGRIYVNQPEWRLRTPGIYLGNDFREAIEKIERLV
jgi:methanogenic corrinoid protein MtbC1